MMADELVEEVLAGPAGPRVGAFFDYDGTVIDGYSVTAFAVDRVRRLNLTPGEAARTLLVGLRGIGDPDAFTTFVTDSLRSWAGRSEDELEELGERLFTRWIAGSLYPQAWELVKAHQRMGHTVVLASSATRFQVAPMARELGVEHVLCTELEAENGILTGRITGPVPYGVGKADAVRAFAAAHGVDLATSYAYSNGDEDVPFLQAAGRPRALNPGRLLAATAAEHGWPVRRFPPRELPDLTTVVRSAAVYGGMLAGVASGLGIGLLNRDRKQAVELGGSFASTLGLALGGITIEVRGEHNLWARRPAVFVFNHQSALDVLVMIKLLRRDVSAVAKKELASVPLLGQFFRLADVAFVERGNTDQARAALEPAVRKLREGVSLAMSPEGTRTVTPRLGRFKKGAFHVAMQAGVPIVPVVIRNAGEIMWKGARTFRRGTVQVVVHDPVPTAGWTVAGLDDEVARVRQLYLDTLDDWPGGGGSRG
ncbi:MAG TPA: HAD-IB family hydrolase [Pseudonocardiaceae bacterium]